MAFRSRIARSEAPAAGRIPARLSRTRRCPGIWVSSASPPSICASCRPIPNAASFWLKAPCPAPRAAGSWCAMRSRRRFRRRRRNPASSAPPPRAHRPRQRAKLPRQTARRGRDMELTVTTLAGEAAGSVTVSDAIFGLTPRPDLIQRCVVWQLAKRQRGTHDVKNRAEITRTGKKMYKQKGTGSARHGSARVNLFRGGGRSFGPTPRSHAIDLPKKVRALALRHALSAKAQDGGIVVLDVVAAKDPKTKVLREQLDKLGIRSALIVDGTEVDNNFRLAARNIPDIDVLPVQGVNVYDILRRPKLVLTKAAIEALEARFK